MVRHRDQDGRVEEVEMGVSEMSTAKREKTGKKLLMPFGEKLEVCGIAGVCSGVGKEPLHFGKDRRQHLHGCLIGELQI